jgi:LysM repeat protein
MSRFFSAFVMFSVCALVAPRGLAQGNTTEQNELLALSKKIDEQNLKIDALSQQILKLQQAVTQGKSTNFPTTVGVPEETATPAPVLSGNTHVVARGETLTSIAKLYHVGIDELQKFNHIEDARKLQPGQKLAIPAGATATPATAPTASPNE